jgi:hypothetical protein
MPEAMTRAPNLDVREVPDGYIIYHGARDNVCYLNTTAAIVFELCDAHMEKGEVVRRVAKIFDLGASSHGEIRACIDSLIKEGLIDSNAT